MERKTIRTREQVAAILVEWEHSKLSKKEFCSLKGINYQTFIGWIVNRRNREQEGERKFVPIRVEAATSDVFAELHLSTHKKIVFRQAVSAEFIRTLLKC